MCVLHVRSETTSFIEFLKNTQLPVYMSHEKGEERYQGYKYSPPHEDYGFSCEVSNRKWDNLNGQIEDTFHFFEKYENELTDLIQKFSINDICLDFPYYCRHNSKIIVQCDYLPPKLLLMAGKLNIGIELSLYPNPEETSDEWPQQD